MASVFKAHAVYICNVLIIKNVFMKNIEPFLNFNGNCEEAFKFYSAAFGQKISALYRYSDIDENGDFPESVANRICYINLPVTEYVSLIGSDSTDDTGYIAGGNVSVMVNVQDREEAKNLYEKLSDGGNIFMPLGKTDWTDLYAYFTDKFGINWMINLIMPNGNGKVKNIEPFLHFSGNSEDALTFYSTVFDKKISSVFRYKDFKDTTGIPDSDMNYICFANLQVSEHVALLASDSPSSIENLVGNNVTVTINAETKEEADILYKKLSAGGQIIMPLGKTEWSEYYAWFIDKFGIYWMIDLVVPN